MEEKTKTRGRRKKKYSPNDLDRSVKVLLSHLSSDSKASSSKELRIRAAAAMLHDLAKASGGAVIAGCCTQECCNEAALKIIKKPPR